ncbi:DUF6807 domain-containing protein [Lunatibacter salilacus]|uniref:DUF6807 domain-containing protein n=1 Tax=Lunatibacter salilacus TaxID=2483804 RepID=UPI00131D7E3F|nr:PmoA family protein [Lunatibacter salilacus]
MRNFGYLCFLFCLSLASCTSDPIAQLEIVVTKQNRLQTPISFNIDKELDIGLAYHLLDKATGEKSPLEIQPDGSLFALLPSLSEGTNVFELRIGAIEVEKGIKLNKTDQGVEVSYGSKPIFFYQAETAYPAEGLPDYYKRSGMIHPLYSPGGQILTDDFPTGHVHQHAIFNAWVNTMYKGEKVDFWNQHQGTGTVEHVDILETDQGTLTATLRTKLSHISLKHGEVLEEEWEIKVYPTEDYFMFDLYSEQLNTSQDTLYIVEYHYGGMGIRGSKEWNIVDSVNYTNDWKIQTSEGKTNADANHTKASWVSAHGLVEGENAGVTVFGFPDNFRYPQIVRVHPTMPYWVYSPMFEGEFYIAPGEKFYNKVRYYAHQGEPDANVLSSIQADLTDPVQVTVLPKK